MRNSHTISVLQLIDQRIIRSLKNKYYASCLEVQQRIPSTKDCNKVPLFDAISMLPLSWNAISMEMIANYYLAGWML
jgi:hypothetical protein